MALDLDNYLSLHANSLAIRGKRMEVLADNVANADTPGYKAKDIDFKAAMQAVETARAGDQAGGIEAALESAKRFRTPLQPSMDGNTVDGDMERAAFADNAIRYQASLQFLNGRIRSLTLALTGGK